jgi:CheY-like chemotaxis protein
MDNEPQPPAPPSTSVPMPTSTPAPASAPTGAPGPAPTTQAVPAPIESALTPPKKRILIIDDEASFARMVKLNLEKTGKFDVRVENKANYAVSTAREFRPDLILLDVIMPAMDGGDVSNQIKRDRTLRDIPLIFLTATVSKREAGDVGLNSGGEFFLGKPVSVETLIHCINERIRKPELPPEVKP